MNKKGSEWIKWDLHLHTPNSHLNSKYNCDFKTLADKIISEGIKVVGLTNYFILEESEIIELKKHLPDDILILPNFEFRINDKNRNGEFINLHIIFNPHLKYQRIIEALGRVKLNNIAGDTAKYCTIENVKELGADNITIALDDLKEQLQSDFKHYEDYLIVGVSNGYGGFHPDNKPRNIQLAVKIDSLSDLIFGRQQDVKFFLNQEGSRSDEIKQPKAVLACSDAHSISDIGKTFTWIKANATYEGLKQVLYEPESRVQIQNEAPDYKKDYLTIEKVRFLLKNKRFIDRDIYLNKTLNSIIGGKSSGKSLLLYHIANTISPNLVKEIHQRFDKSNKTFGYNIPELDFEITWSDGLVQKMSDADDQSRPITYVPQFYINEIAENTQDRNALNELITDILKEKPAYSEFLAERINEVQRLKEKISLDIVRFFNIRDNIHEKNKEISEIGDKQSIENNIKKLVEELEKLRKESDFSEEDEKKYKDLFVVKEHYLQNQLHFESILGELSNFKSELGRILDGGKGSIFSPEINSLVSNYNQDDTKGLIKILEENLLSNSKTTIKSFLSFAFKSRFEHFIGELTFTNKEIERHLELLKPYEDKLKNKEKFDRIQKEIKEERDKIKKIDDKLNEKAKLIQELNEINLVGTYSDIYTNYIIRSDKNGEFKFIGEDIELTSTISFDNKIFDNNFINRVSKKSSLQNQISNEIFDGNNFKFNPDSHIDYITIIFNSIIEDKISFNQGTSSKDAIIGLLHDCFKIEFDLKQGGDKLLHMSPGKRGLVLFQLFLQLSNSAYPILIDQPEDNLDNRTVYTQLNDFIKNRKAKRQILMVSHNANLVVSTDSENVIVANQHGQNKESQKKEFDFEYVNGALEVSFKKPDKVGVLYQKGIREHVCEILEGGEEAFLNREKKYGLN